MEPPCEFYLRESSGVKKIHPSVGMFNCIAKILLIGVQTIIFMPVRHLLRWQLTLAHILNVSPFVTAGSEEPPSLMMLEKQIVL